MAGRRDTFVINSFFRFLINDGNGFDEVQPTNIIR